MEDCSALVSDCIIISCCCQCLVLQLVIFVFLRFPRNVARKVKEYAKRRLRDRRKKKKKKQGDQQEKVVEGDKSMSLRILELEGMAIKELHKWGSCEEEVEKVLGELALKGEFGFGSFWGRETEIQTRKYCYCKCNRRLTKDEELDFGSHVVKFHLIEVVRPFSPSP